MSAVVDRDVKELLHDYRQYSGKRPTAVCLGNFDGIHRGHQRILSTCLQEAKRWELASCVFTFWPHPDSVLQHRNGTPRLLLTLAEKRELLQKAGMDIILEQEFNLEFSKISPEAFVEILKSGLRAEKIIVGENFRFGYKAQGNIDFLRAEFQENLIIVPTEQSGNVTISSSYIRNTILQEPSGLEEANSALGYFYFLTGEVVHGTHAGTSLGFPTANLASAKDCVPTDGVYASIVEDLESKNFFCAATNIGLNPTLGSASQRRSIECHLLDFEDDLYGRQLRVFLLKFLRSEFKFPSVQALKVGFRTICNYVRPTLRPETNAAFARNLEAAVMPPCS